MKTFIQAVLIVLLSVPCIGQDMKVEEFIATIETNLFDVSKGKEYKVVATANDCMVGFIVVDGSSKLTYGTCAWGCNVTVDDLYNESVELWSNFRYKAEHDSIMYVSTHSIIPMHPLDWEVSGNKISLEFKNGRKAYYVRFTRKIYLSEGSKL